MNRIAAFVTEHARLAWSLGLSVIAVAALLVGLELRLQREAERLRRELDTARRRTGPSRPAPSLLDADDLADAP